ncbi:T9SS type A sorting domain-containing protein [Thalassobellus suaedae]|uniref:T9SS type A sorting domain-containing protein n=1 Tax=Thalassobellus suaedae TaxID=3074124 RepID=A0ABY9Y184_9FLAO|nr:T9SS type A sorting domain-containing protein [Flavobacteriaceae bacterium HL-DH10]
MMKKLLLLVALITTSFTYSQIVTVDSAPASLEQGEVFTMFGSFDAISPDSVENNLAFVLRLYDTTTNNYVSQIAFGSVNKNGITAGSNVESAPMTVPSDLTPTADLPADREYRLVVSYKRTIAGDFPNATQVVTITEAVVPTISYSSLPTEITSEGAPNQPGYGYGVLPYEVTWSNLTVTTPASKIFNQLKDAGGAQVAGTSFDVTTPNGSMTLSWGYFGGGLLVAGTQAGVFSQYSGGGANNITAKINVVATLGTKDFEINKVSVYPNPTKDLITISTQSSYKSISVYDLTGKTVKTFGETKLLNVSEFSNGMYFLKTDTGLQAKFIKQ